MTKLEKIIQNITEDTVKDLYITRDLTREQCAKELNISYNMFNQLLAYYNIHVDKRGGNQIKPGEFSPKFKQILATVKYDDIVEVYINQRLSLDKCAAALGICGESFVKLVKYYGLSREMKPGSKGGNSNFDKALKRINREEFIDDYINKNMTYADMKQKYNISYWNLDKVIKEFGCHKSRAQSAIHVQQTKYKNAGSKEEYIKQITEKARQTKIQTYGSLDNYHEYMVNKVRDSFIKNDTLTKMYNTKKDHNSFHSSNPEDKYYEYLLTIYPEDDIDRQHKEERYPFNCDFYIRSEDLFIECNYSWTHGGHPFDPENEADQRTLAEWQQKAETSDFYKNAIETWTIRDVAKQKVAKDNNLNYEVLY